MENMWKIKSFNFTQWDATGFDPVAAILQIDRMVEECAINTVTFAFSALQEHAFSTDIDWKGTRVLKAGPLTGLVEHARSKGLKHPKADA